VIRQPWPAVLLSIGAFGLASCGTKPNPEAQGLECKSEICPVTIAISAPGPMTYTNKDLPIQVTVMPPNHGPAQVQLLKDGALLAPLDAPFAYMWRTTQEREATYQIIASATINGQTVTSEPITVVVDRTSPTMESRPALGASNVALSDPIQITFSEPVDPATVPSTAISLKDSGGASLGASSMLSSDGMTLTVSDWTRSALILPATVMESIAPTIADRAGNALVVPAPWSWTAPLWVKLPSLLGRGPSLALDGAGQPVISFTKPDPVNPSSGVGPLGIARYALGSTWDLSLGAPTSANIGQTAIAVDGLGAPVVAWPDQNHVRLARLSGGSWQSIGGDADAGLPSAPMAVPSLALDAAGNPTVGIWDFVSQMGPPSGYVARWSGSAWQLLTPPTMPFATSSGGPLIAIDSTGAPTVWSNGTLQRYVSASWLTIDLSMPNTLTYATLALDSQDRPVLAFRMDSGGLTTLDVRVLVANTWQAFSPSVASQVRSISEAHVAMAPDGNPVVAWIESADPLAILRVARYTGQSWSAQLGTLNAVSGSIPARVQLAVDALGAPTVAWEEYDPGTATTSVYVWKSNL
jgi:Bacterial Ig-like domain